MEGLIISYRRGKRNHTVNHAIVLVDGVDSREKATKFVGKKTAWKSIKAVINGEIAAAHGNKGALRVRFERGLPGQAINQKIAIQ